MKVISSFSCKVKGNRKKVEQDLDLLDLDSPEVIAQMIKDVERVKNNIKKKGYSGRIVGVTYEER